MSRRPWGAVLLVVAAVAAVAGTFLPLFWEGSAADPDLGFVTTAWRTTTGAAEVDVELMLGVRATRYGVPITVAAAVLLVAAGGSLLPGRRAPVATYAAVAGAALLAGAVWTTGMGVAAAVEPSAHNFEGYAQEVREGTWLLVLSAVVAAAGATLVHTRRPATPHPTPAQHPTAPHRPTSHVTTTAAMTTTDDADDDTRPHDIPPEAIVVAHLPESDYRPPAEHPRPPSGRGLPR
ncbi:hypothetical protein [Saccharothrix sp. Mg75]|uniref:hypothetical protein n=1 Tax=Saccharothrix sp. Mg75 TaxID=3445357 RepID=UPI003EED5D37